MRKYLLLSLILAWAGSGMAADAGRLERDLGEGLAYIRVRSLPADLPAAHAKPVAVVLDVRFVHADSSAAAALGAWLQFQSSARTPVFVLVNAGTAPPVLDFFEHANPIAGLITLGLASPRFVPDIPLKVPAAIDRLAYDALDQGSSMEALLTDQPGKPRHDEASIAQEHQAANDAAAADGPVLTDPAETRVTPPPAPKPLTDPTLQRAVHLHRTLKALHRI